MTKKLFSPKLFLQTLLRLKTIGIAMLVSVALLNIFQPLSEMVTVEYVYETVMDENGMIVDADDRYVPRITEVEGDTFAPFLWAMLIFAPLSTYLAFGYLHVRSKADFFHSLPQTRVCVCLSTLAAVLVWTLGTVVASSCLNALLWWLAPYCTLAPMIFFGSVAHFSVIVLFLVALMTVSVFLTGTTVSTVITFCWLLFCPPLAGFMFCDALERIAPIIEDTDALKGIFSPDYFVRLLSDNLSADIGTLLYYVVLSLLLIAAACALSHIRRSESAGKSAPNTCLQHIYRTLFTFAPAVMATNLIITDQENVTDADGYVIFFLILVSVVAYLLYELLTTKKLRRMVRSIPLLIFPLLLCLVFASSVYGARAHIYRVRPEADEVASVTVTKRTGSGGWQTHGETYLIGKPITDPDLVAMAVSGLYDTLDDATVRNGEYLSVTFRLENGYRFSRSIRVTRDFWQAYCRLPENVETYLSLPTWEQINRCEMAPAEGSSQSPSPLKREIWECFTAEYAALSTQEKLRVMHGSRLQSNVKELFSYYIELTNYQGAGEPDNSITVLALSPELTPETIALMTERAYGSGQAVLKLLMAIRTEYESFGSFPTVMIADTFGEWQPIDTGDFFDAVTLDENLLDENADRVLVAFGEGKYAFWLALPDNIG